MLSASSFRELLDAPPTELMPAAAARRDAQTGRRITFSPKVFAPLTMLCRDRCGYCTFAKPPARLDAPYLTEQQVLELASRGAALGCSEALFTLGEAPEDRYPQAATWLHERGFDSTVDYLVAVAKRVLGETGLLPHANAGALSEAELMRLRAVSPSQGMMIETLADRLHEPGGAHFGAPDKTAARRLATLHAAGRARVPFTTGILVGIGETRAERIEALVAIANAHLEHGHVQEIIVQNFLPKPGTAMHRADPCPTDEFLWSIAAARLILPAEVHLQAPPNLSDDLTPLLAAGIDDWGGVSPLTIDHVNPERPWPALDHLREATEAAGFVLAPRLTVYPEYVQRAEEWLHPDVRTAVLVASDLEGCARDTAWAPGRDDLEPPQLVPAARASAGGAVGEVLAGVLAGVEVGIDEIVTLLAARGPEVARVAEVADQLRREIVGDEVTFVRNRNINYTNVCTFRCKFCAFSKGPLSLNLRGKPYLVEMEEMQRRVVEAVECGATEVCLQGGIHPDFDGDYYVDVARAVKEVAPTIHVHGFTALEVTEGARRLGMPLHDYLLRLKAAGLATLPGTAAEILDDEVRAIICPDKVNTEEWLFAHRTAHEVGLKSNVTIMHGTVERPVHIARHLVRTRDLQKETGGFTEFVPLPFVHMATPIFIQGKARRGPTFREVLLMHAVGRIAYRDTIPNVQASWVKCGIAGSRQILQAGANDLGGTLMDENISRAAGASHGQELDEAEFRSIVEPIGRTLAQRTTLYGRAQTVGRRLRPVDEHSVAPAAPRVELTMGSKR
jgi:7,8-didemethyl-8-hydroxy-5-deazariboflavin synthase CofH subunit/7,8-didemethyl-8-hydroxy-5-deazariboflavin synthase CofG subunit